MYGFIRFLVLFVLAVGVPVAAHAEDNCSDALLYTGRESKIVLTHEQWEKFRHFAHENHNNHDVNATFPIENIIIKFGGSAKSDDRMIEIQNEKSERTFYTQLQTVFAPAVEAWRACMDASSRAATFIPKIDSPTSLSISVGPAVTGSEIKLNGAEYDPELVACTYSNDKINGALTADTRLTLTGLVSVICRRKAGSAQETTIHVNLSTKLYSVTLPRAAGPPKSFKTHSSTPGPFQSFCEYWWSVPPADFDRTAAFENVTLQAQFNENSSSTAVLTIMASGDIYQFRGARRPDETSGGQRNSPDIPFLIPAFTPALLHVSGGVENGGSCKFVTGNVRIPF